MNGSQDDNPFALPAKRGRSQRGLARSLTLLVICAGAAYGLHLTSRMWLMDRLVTNLEDHPDAVQRERVAMLAEFGDAGIEPLVNLLASDDEGLAKHAFAELSALRSRWSTGTASQPDRSNQLLLDQLAQTIPGIPLHRHPWIVGLLDELMADSPGTVDGKLNNIHAQAATLIASLAEVDSQSLVQNVNDSVFAKASSLVGDNVETAEQVSGVRRLDPLPTKFLRTLADEQNSSALPASGGDLPVTIGSLPATSGRSLTGLADGDEPSRAASYELANAEPAELLDIRPDAVTVTAAASEALGENPFGAFDTYSVMQALDEQRPFLMNAAIRELRSRGFTSGDLEMAGRLVAAEVSSRLTMIDELPSRVDIDPRQWLLWLAIDPDREVRLKAISVLATMDDPAVQNELRKLLKDERDTRVASRLRSALGLR